MQKLGVVAKNFLLKALDVSVAYTLVTHGGGHMLSEKSQLTQNGTMFVDLD